MQQDTAFTDLLLTELIIDRYTSKWIGLPPQYPAAKGLIGQLATERGVKKHCLNTKPEQLKELCGEYPWSQELETLWNQQEYYEDLDHLSSETQISPVTEYIEIRLRTPLMLIKARAIQAIIKISDHPEKVLAKYQTRPDLQELIYDLLRYKTEIKNQN